jgi:hypothetical protein
VSPLLGVGLCSFFQVVAIFRLVKNVPYEFDKTDVEELPEEA